MRAKKQTYDAVYSLGTNCAASDYLRRMGLRKGAGPFDWIRAEDPRCPFETILSDFNNFLQKEDLVLADFQDPQKIRCIYHNKRSRYTFFHDFSCELTLEEQFKQVSDKYNRRKERFLKDISSKKKILLVWYAEWNGFLKQEELKEYADKLNAFFGREIDFLFIQYNSEQKEDINYYSLAEYADCYILGNLAEHPRVEGNLFWDEKRITPLFKSISVKRSIGERIKSLKPVWVRIRAAFIWNKTKRHQFVESRLGK